MEPTLTSLRLVLSQQGLSLTWIPAQSLKPLNVLKLPVQKWEISKCQSSADTTIKRSRLESERAWGSGGGRVGWGLLYIVTLWISTHHIMFCLLTVLNFSLRCFTPRCLLLCHLVCLKCQPLEIMAVHQLDGSRVKQIIGTFQKSPLHVLYYVGNMVCREASSDITWHWVCFDQIFSCSLIFYTTSWIVLDYISRTKEILKLTLNCFWPMPHVYNFRCHLRNHILVLSFFF